MIFNRIGLSFYYQSETNFLKLGIENIGIGDSKITLNKFKNNTNFESLSFYIEPFCLPLKKYFLIKTSLVLSFMVFAMQLNSVSVVILQIKKQGVPYKELSSLDAYKDLPIIFVSFFISSFLLKLKIKDTMLLALFLSGMGSLLIPFLPQLWFFKVWYVVIGTCFAAIKLGILSIIGCISKTAKSHNSLMSVVESGFMGGILLVNIFFSYLVENNSPQGWLYNFWIMAFFSGVAFLLFLFSDFSEIHAHLSQESSSSFSLSFLKEKKVLYPLVLLFLVVVLEQSINSWLPSFFHNALHTSTVLSIQAVSFFAGISMIGRLITGSLIMRFSWRAYLIFCLLIAGGILSALLLIINKEQYHTLIHSWADLPSYLYLFPLLGLFLSPLYPLINSHALLGVSVNKRPLFISLIILFSSLGGAFGSYIIGNLFQFIGEKYAFFFPVLVIGLLIIGLLKFSPEKSEE